MGQPVGLLVRAQFGAGGRRHMVAIDPTLSVTLVDDEVSPIRVENLERAQCLRGQFMIPSLGAKVNEVTDAEVLILRAYPGIPGALIAGLVFVQGRAHLGMTFFSPLMMARFAISGVPSAVPIVGEPVSPSTVRFGIPRGMRRSNGATPVARCGQVL